MNVMHHDIGRDRYYKIWNTTKEAMIIYTYSDGGSMVFADKMFPIKKGALCFIASAVRHYTMPNQPSEYDRSKIFVSMDVVHQLLNLMSVNSEMYNLYSNNSVVYAQIPVNFRKEIEIIFADAEGAMLKKDCFEELLISSFFRLMIYLKRFTVQHIPSPDDFLSKAIEYINLSFFKKISLNDICESIHVSNYHFCRRFKRVMGMTVMDYIQQTRMANAKNLLKNSNLGIEMIAEQCGFSSLSYFSQIFKQSTGISASLYRKEKAL